MKPPVDYTILERSVKEKLEKLAEEGEDTKSRDQDIAHVFYAEISPDAEVFRGVSSPAATATRHRSAITTAASTLEAQSASRRASFAHGAPFLVLPLLMSRKRPACAAHERLATGILLAPVDSSKCVWIRSKAAGVFMFSKHLGVRISSGLEFPNQIWYAPNMTQTAKENYTYITISSALRVRRVKVGEKLGPDDLYQSTSGSWKQCPCPGLTVVEGAPTAWFRPV